MPSSGVYVGSVVHSRLRPRRHRLSYSCYWLFLDLDEFEAISRRIRAFSLERLNLFSLCNRDHGTGSSIPFRDQAEGQLMRAGIDTEGGKIFLLTMPRILGHGFNPLSVYYCYRKDGALAALIYEVHNTFGQRHSYLIPASAKDGKVRQSCEKCFYVSPFMDLGLNYEFEISEPDERVSVAIRVSDTSGTLLTASLAGARKQLSDRTLLKCFVTHPLLTMKVVAAIHWEAARLWWKGVRLVPRPAPPDHPVTASSVANLRQAKND
jgi:DUF1365 family protein